MDVFRSIIGTIADGVVIVDQDGITRFVNPAAEQLFGRPASELIGHEFGFPIVTGETAEFEILHPRTGPVTTELRVSALMWDGAPALLAAVRDITERVRAQERDKQLVREQALRLSAEASERRARFLSEAASTLAASLDYRTTLWDLAQLSVPFLAEWCIIDLLEVDGTFERIAVATASERGRPFVSALRRLVPATEPGSGAARSLRSAQPLIALDPSAPVVQGVLGVTSDSTLPQKAGIGACMVLPLTIRDVRVGIMTLCAAESARVFDDADLELAGEVAARAAAAIDNGRLYTAAQQANQAKADFLAVMSHELRTPLNAIIGYSDLMMLGIPKPVPEHAQDQIRRIRASARHLLGLIEEILTYSRVEAGQEELHIEDVDVQTLVGEVASLIQPLAAARSLKLNLQLPPTPLRISTDAQKLRQVLLNLLSNAVKFTEEGAVTLQLSEESDDVCFRIRDTGPGIDAEDLAHIFEPFWQAEQSRTRRAEGTGLGLAVVRRLVHLVGGKVLVDSAPGQGSTFTVWLPRQGPRQLHTRL